MFYSANKVPLFYKNFRIAKIMNFRFILFISIAIPIMLLQSCKNDTIKQPVDYVDMFIGTSN